MAGGLRNDDWTRKGNDAQQIEWVGCKHKKQEDVSKSEKKQTMHWVWRDEEREKTLQPFANREKNFDIKKYPEQK